MKQFAIPIAAAGVGGLLTFAVVGSESPRCYTKFVQGDGSVYAPPPGQQFVLTDVEEEGGTFGQLELGQCSTIPSPSPSSSPTPDPSPSGSPPPERECDPPCEGREECRDGRCVVPSPGPSPSPSGSPCPCGKREDDTCRPCPSPSPSGSPSPSPSPSPSGTPGPGPTPVPNCANLPKPCGTGIRNDDGSMPDGATGWSKECVWKDPQRSEPVCKWPEWLPVTCASLPDDPPGLLRTGPACDTPGGSGTGPIYVTNLKSSGAGSFLAAYNQVDERNRRVICGPPGSDGSPVPPTPFLEGDIVLDPGLIWSKPYATIDFSRCKVLLKSPKKGVNILIFARGVHDVIVSNLASDGWFVGNDPNWGVTNNAGSLAMDGDTNPVQYPWDKEWASTHPNWRHIVRRILFDRVSTTGCEDDCLMPWEGVRDVSILRAYMSGWHPNSLGAGGWPLTTDRWRQRIAYIYSGWFDSGERQPKPRESAHLWAILRSIVFNWSCWVDKNGNRTEAIGLNISDDARNENDFGYVDGSCYLPGPGSNMPPCGNRRAWGVIMGNGYTCEACGNCTYPPNHPKAGQRIPPTDYAFCNPKMEPTHYWFRAVEGENNEGVTNPPGWVPSGPHAIPFPYDPARPWDQVFDEMGPIFRPDKVADGIARARALIAGCKVKN